MSPRPPGIHVLPTPFSAGFWLGGAVLTLLMAMPPSASAQRLPPDPVEELQSSLKEVIVYPLPIDKPSQDLVNKMLATREKDLTKEIDHLKSLSQLIRAIMLKDWNISEDPNLRSPEDPVKVRLLRELETRAEARLKAILGKAAAKGSIDEIRQIAAVRLIGQMMYFDESQPTILRRSWINSAASGLSINLLDAFQNEKLTETVRVEAIAAFGRLNPEKSRRLEDPIQAMVKAVSTVNGRGASDALKIAAMQGLANLPTSLIPLIVNKRSGDPLSGEARLREVARVVLPEYLRAMAPGEPLEVRQAATLGTNELFRGLLVVSRGILRQVDSAPYPSPDRTLTPGELQKLRDELLPITQQMERLGPLIPVFEKNLPLLSQALNDPDPMVASQAKEAAERMASLRRRFLTRREELAPYMNQIAPKPAKKNGEQPKGLPPKTGTEEGQQEPAKPATSPVPAVALKALVPGLRDSLRDPETTQGVLLALEALEQIGAEARDAVPEIIAHLDSSNLFVRWAAARALSKVCDPKDPGKKAIEGLAKLITDDDLDVRLAGATALTRLEPTPELTSVAVPALAQMIGDPRRDSESRVELLQALIFMGTAAKDALPAITRALQSEDQEVRKAAANVLGRLGPLAKDAIPALQKALDDPDEEVRKLAGEALLSVSRE